MAVPILLSSCARAATAAEARYRLDYPIAPSRATRVIALDEGAEPTLRSVAAQSWASARFLVASNQPTDGDWSPAGGLRVLDGEPVQLAGQLDGASSVVMLASADTAAAPAATIGAACTVRGIMTAGLIVGGRHGTGAALSAMRPHARVLMVAEDHQEVAEFLTALRA